MPSDNDANSVGEKPVKWIVMSVISVVSLCGCALGQDINIATPVIVRVEDMSQVAENTIAATPTSGPIPINSALTPVAEATTPEMTVEPSTTTIPPTELPASTPTAFPNGLYDALHVMSGICFESAFDAAGQVFVLRDAEAHIRFYSLADNAGLCRRAVTRYPFDFSQGDILAGLWSVGAGCVARHDILAVERDDPAQTLAITLDFVTEGACPYELVRPFWVGIPNATNYDIRIDILDND